MDKYFSPTYDPLVDFTPSQLSLSASASNQDEPYGLIAEGSFNSWDRMLSAIKERKEEKKLRESREKEERRKERERKRRERRRKRGESVSSSEESEHGGKEGSGGLMEIKYSKKGGTREWDLGKETPT